MTDKSDTFEDKMIAFVWKAQEDAAAIARVREVCRDPSKRMAATSHMNVEWVDLNAVLRALDGE